MAIFGMPAGMVGLMGAGSGGGGGFLGALGGGMNAFAQAEQAQAQRSDAGMGDMLEIARMQQQIRNAHLQQQQQEQQKMQALAQQGQAEELRGQIPGHLQELFDVDQETAIARAFPKAQDPTSLQQNLAAAGLQPGTEQYQQTVLDTVTKRRQGETGAIKLPNGYRFADPGNPAAGVVPLKGGPADTNRPTTEQRNKLANAQKTHRQLTSQIGQYAQTLRKGISNLPGSERDKVKTQRTQIKLQLKNLYELGAITGPDEEILNDLIMDPTGLSQRAVGVLPGVQSPEERALENLGVLMEEADRALQAATGNNPKAVQPAEPVMSDNPADYSIEDLERIANGG